MGTTKKAHPPLKKQGESGTVVESTKGGSAREMMPRPLPGLKNMGNTCWLNAVIQALTHCQCLVEAIEQSGHPENSTSPKCVLSAVEAHIRAACRSSAPFMSPEKIVNLLPLISSSLMRGRQEDAHEFLRTLVSSMQGALEQRTGTKGDAQSDDEASQISGFSNSRKRRGHARKTAASERRSNRLKSTKEEEEEDNLTDSENDESTSVSAVESQYPFSLFKGAIQNQVRCTRCKKLSTKEDPVEDLELEIARSSSLESALTQFCAEEELKDDNAYHCDKCRAKVTARKRIRLHRVPPVLTMSLKRFAVPPPYVPSSSSSSSLSSESQKALSSPPPEAGSGSRGGGLWGLFSASKSGQGQEQGQTESQRSRYDTKVNTSTISRRGRGRGGPQKIQHYVHYPEYLDLTTYCSTADKEKDAKKHSHERYMRLFAVVVHLGSTIGAGHYVAYVRSLATTTTLGNKSSGSNGGERATAGWHRMDDCNVTLCSTEEALNQCAYILFYERCPDSEVRQWQQAQADGRLSDINRIYSEKLLASQSKEERRVPKLGEDNAEEDERAEVEEGVEVKDVVVKSKNKGKKQRKTTRTAPAKRRQGRSSHSVVRALRMDEEGENDHGEKHKDAVEEIQEDGDEKQRRRDSGGGGILSWLFASSPTSPPRASPALASTSATVADADDNSVAPAGTGRGRNGTPTKTSTVIRSSARQADAGRVTGSAAAVRRSGRRRGAGAPSSESTPMDEDNEEEEGVTSSTSAPLTRARKRQKVAPGEGIVKAVAEFVGGMFYEI